MQGKKVLITVFVLVLLIAIGTAVRAASGRSRISYQECHDHRTFQARWRFDLQARILAPFMEKYLPKK